MNVSVINNRVFIDGQEYTAKADTGNGKAKVLINGVEVGEYSGKIEITISGNLRSITSHDLSVIGDVGEVDCHNLRCGNIAGNVDAHNVTCGDIKGRVDAHNVSRR